MTLTKSLLASLSVQKNRFCPTKFSMTTCGRGILGQRQGVSFNQVQDDVWKDILGQRQVLNLIQERNLVSRITGDLVVLVQGEQKLH